ncbi:hypothetical protein DAMA08_023180 [Martiniozyma asiatica (nom. inval.)]|nr:hypothetical protein DAMA08_023180 [Martiniozyma asiatica]
MQFAQYLDADVDDLFKKYKVAELEKLKGSLSTEVTEKRALLRKMVGDKYRELLHVADDIVYMNKITAETNNKLAEFAFQNANYNPQYLVNLEKFNGVSTKGKLRKTRLNHHGGVLMNIIHSFNYELIQLKRVLFEEVANRNHLGENDVNDGYNKFPDEISNTFIKLSKVLFLVEHFFNEVIFSDAKSFSVVKFLQLKSEFLELIQRFIGELCHENDTDFIIHLLIAFIITTKSKITEAFELFLSTRLEHLSLLVKNDQFTIQSQLSYIYITCEIYEMAQYRLPTLIQRQFTSVNANWIQHTDFLKWKKWLNISDNFTVSFPTASLKISKDESVTTLNKWKQLVGSEFKKLIDLIFTSTMANSRDVIYLSSLLPSIKLVLLSFKKFSSLCDLSASGEKIVDYTLASIESTAFDVIKSTFNDFSNVNTIINENIKKINDNGIDENFFSIEPSIDDYVEMLMSSNEENNRFNENTNVQKQLKNLLISYNKNLTTLKDTLKDLNRLSHTISRPIISLDDTENESFWNEVSLKIEQIALNCIEESVKLQREQLYQFEKEISNLQNVEIDAWIYLCQALIMIDKVLSTKEWEKSLLIINKNVNCDSSYFDLSSVLEKSLSNLTSSLLDSKVKELKSLLENRFKSDQTYNEIISWDEFITSDNEKFLLPTCPSVEFSSWLHKFTQQLAKLDMDVKEFTRPKENAILRIIEEFKILFDNVKIQDNTKTDSIGLLLTYSDVLFTKNLLAKSESSVENLSSLISTISALNANFENESYTEAIQKGIENSFAVQKLLYWPLCS